MILCANELDNEYPRIQPQNNKSEREAREGPHGTRQLLTRIHHEDSMGHVQDRPQLTTKKWERQIYIRSRAEIDKRRRYQPRLCTMPGIEASNTRMAGSVQDILRVATSGTSKQLVSRVKDKSRPLSTIDFCSRS